MRGSVKLPLRYFVHSKQLAIIFGIAASGLVCGSVFAMNSMKDIANSSSPSPTRTLSSATPSVTVVALTPSPKVSPSPSPRPSPILQSPKPPPAQAKKDHFSWGITLQPFPFRENNDQFLTEQFRLAKELGVKTVRVDYSPQNETANQHAVALAKQHGLTLIFIIPFGPNDIFTDAKLYDNAYQYVAGIVGKYKGQVAIWQLANEVGAVALVDGLHHGVDRVDYPEDKYQAVVTWLKAAAKATHDTDPNAKRLLTDHWIHTGFFDRFLAEGGDFDILGWNWFSDMGTNMDKVLIDKKTGQTYKLLSKLKSYKKELYLTEVNRRLGSQDGREKEQADYIQTMAEYAYAQPGISGFLVYLLVEDQSARVEEAGYSLVHTNIDSHTVTGLKQAYSRYRDLINAKNP